MNEIFKIERAVFLGVVAGAVFGFFSGLDVPQSDMAYQKVPLLVIVPFGLIAPLIVVRLQKPLFQRSKPRWFHRVNRHINLLFFFSLWALTFAVKQSSVGPALWETNVAFFGAVGGGMFISGLLERRWVRQQSAARSRIDRRDPPGPWG